MPSAPASNISRAARLAALLVADPTNASLLIAAATAAYDEGDVRGCRFLLDRYGAAHPISAELWNLKGLVAMSDAAFDEAAEAFGSALAMAFDPVVCFNLAYARAMQGEFEQSLQLTSQPELAEVPGAMALRMRALHHLGRLEEMVSCGRDALSARQDTEIAGLLATGLFDAGDLAQARIMAPRALESSDGCTVAGMLALDAGEEQRAMDFFAQALTVRPQSGRALLGKGLALLNAGHLAAAAETLERASQSMGAHAGTWTATGWAYLLQSESDKALSCFERAMEADRGFSEGAGGLAVAYLAKNDRARAEHYAEVALRLDPNSLSGRYATSLLLASKGRTEEAQALYGQTLSLPVGPEKRTIASALARRSGPTITR